MNALKPSSIIANRRGATLTHILVGLGISAITAAGVGSLMLDSYKNISKISSEIELRSKLAELTLILSKQDLCSSAFAGLSLAEGTDFKIKSPFSSSSFLEKGKSTIKGVEVTKIRWGDILTDPLAPDNALARLDLEFKDKNKDQVESKKVYLNINKVTGQNRLASCQSMDAYERGQIYGRCSFTTGKNDKSLETISPIWPFVRCSEKGSKQPPVCASGFSLGLLSKSQMNMDDSAINNNNIVYQYFYGCIKTDSGA